MIVRSGVFIKSLMNTRTNKKDRVLPCLFFVVLQSDGVARDLLRPEPYTGSPNKTSSVFSGRGATDRKVYAFDVGKG